MTCGLSRLTSPTMTLRETKPFLEIRKRQPICRVLDQHFFLDFIEEKCNNLRRFSAEDGATAFARNHAVEPTKKHQITIRQIRLHNIL